MGENIITFLVGIALFIGFCLIIFRLVFSILPKDVQEKFNSFKAKSFK